jgi:hypothetical protein
MRGPSNALTRGSTKDIDPKPALNF